MALLEEIIAQVCENNKWAYEIDEENNLILANVGLSDGRTQIVASSVVESPYGECINCRSLVGSLKDPTNEQVMELLEYNSSLVYARVAIFPTDEGGKDVFVIGRTLAHLANAEELVVVLLEVAAAGDTLEEKIFGHDKF